MPRRKRELPPQQTQPDAVVEPNQPMRQVAAPKLNIKTLLLQKVSDTFPNSTVSVVNYELGHPKLQNRGITVPQIGVKVQFTTPKGSFGVAGMIPETADEAAVDQLLGRFKADAIKYEDALTPRAAV